MSDRQEHDLKAETDALAAIELMLREGKIGDLDGRSIVYTKICVYL